MNYPYKNLDNFTLTSLLKRSVKLYPNQKSVGFVNQNAISYLEFNKKVNVSIKQLKTMGIKKGDKVILLGQNMPNWTIAYFAITSFGGVVVPILIDFHQSEIHDIMKHSDAKAIFVSDKMKNIFKNYDNTHIVFAIELDSMSMLDEFTTKKLPENKSKEIAQEDDLASLIYTSGTTGHSKGVMLSHKNLVTNAMSSFEKITITKDDIFLSILPLAHTLECTVGFLTSFLHGSRIHYITKAPTPTVLIKALKDVKPTIIISVPIIIEKIYKNKILPQLTSSLFLRFLYSIPFFRKLLHKKAGKALIEIFGGKIKLYGIGGAALSNTVEQFLIEAKFPYIVGYGLTESAPLLCGCVLGEKYKIKSTGSALYGVEIKIKNKNENGIGEIVAKSPSIMMGYYKNQKATDENIIDGWLQTGDLGYLDKDGFLFISGRNKNVLIGPSGENIYTEQVESIINQIPFLAESLVLQKDGKLIAKINLDYELIESSQSERMKDKEVLLEEMRVEANSKISSYSRIMKFIEEKEPFIKTPTKKIKRYLYQ